MSRQSARMNIPVVFGHNVIGATNGSRVREKVRSAMTTKCQAQHCDCVSSTDVVEGVYNIRPTDFHAHQFDAVYMKGGLYWP